MIGVDIPSSTLHGKTVRGHGQSSFIWMKTNASYSSLNLILFLAIYSEKRKKEKKKKKKASFLYRSLSLPTFVLLVLLVLRIYQPNHCHTPFILCTYVDLCSTLNTRDMVFPFTTVGD